MQSWLLSHGWNRRWSWENWRCTRSVSCRSQGRSASTKGCNSGFIKLEVEQITWTFCCPYVKERKWSCSVVSDSLRPHGLQSIRLLHRWDFPGKSTGMGCYFLFQGLFLTRGSNPVSRIVGRCFTIWPTREDTYVNPYAKMNITWACVGAID